MAFYVFCEPSVDALIEEDSHEVLASMRALASSRNAITWSRVTVGNPCRKSSIVSPPSKYSISVWTGTRVPAKTGVPPSMSGDEVMSGGFGVAMANQDSEGTLDLQATGGLLGCAA